MKRRCGFTNVSAAFCVLTITHLALACGGFGSLYWIVRKWPVRPGGRGPWDEEMSRVMAAVKCAARFYVVRVRCLHYSAAAVCLLRIRRVPANLVIGVRTRPFLAHAWVQVGDTLVAGVRERSAYAIIDRL